MVSYLIMEVEAKQALLSLSDTVVPIDAAQILVTVFKKYSGRNGLQHFILDELSALASQQQKKMWDTLFQALNIIVTNILAESEPNADDAVNKEEVACYILKFGVCTLQCLQLVQKDNQQFVAPDGLRKCTVLVGGVLEALEGKICTAAVALCEEWSLRKLIQSELFGKQLLLILLRQALLRSAKKCDIKRLFQQRHWLGLVLGSKSEIIEDERENQTRLVASVTACLAAPLFLSCDEGIKFLALIMTYRCCHRGGHAGVKELLPVCTRSQASKLGQVYCRAWRDCSAQQRESLENCMQDLMHRFMLVCPQSSPRLSGNLFSFLHALHQFQKLPLFTTVLQQNYNPFLWRHLHCANSRVRRNAVAVLGDAYPLEDLSAVQEEREANLAKVHSTLTEALADTSPDVRITAIQAVCRILANYWMHLPKNTIHEWFQALLNKLAVDASSTQVRVQVIKGVSLLLNCADALAFLKHCLPRLATCFDDVNTSVRIAMVHLLLKLHAHKHIKYWNIVSVDHLLHRLALDTTAVSKLITKLLAPAFLPIHKSDKELLERCLLLIGEHRAASRLFLQYASGSLDVASIVRLVLLLVKSLRQYLVQQRTLCDSSFASGKTNSKRAKKISGSNKENDSPSSVNRLAITENNECSLSSQEEDEESSSLDSSPLARIYVVCGLLDAVFVLWTTNNHRLSQPCNNCWMRILQKAVSRCLPLFATTFKEHAEASRTLLHIASLLPRQLVPTLAGHCLTRLKQLSDKQLNEQKDSREYVAYVNALCNWNRMDDILELVVEALDESLNNNTVGNNSGEEYGTKSNAENSNRGLRISVKNAALSSTNISVHKGRFVKFAPSSTSTGPRPQVALALLDSVLKHPSNRLVMLHKHRTVLLSLLIQLECVRNRFEERLRGLSVVAEAELLHLLKAHLCLAVLLSFHDMQRRPSIEHHIAIGARRRAGRLSATNARNENNSSTCTLESSTNPDTPYNAEQLFLPYFAWAESALVPHLEGFTSSGNVLVPTSDASVLDTVTGTQVRKRKLRSSKHQLSPSEMSAAAIATLLRMTADAAAAGVITSLMITRGCHLASLALLNAGTSVSSTVEETPGVLSSSLAVFYECFLYVRVLREQRSEEVSGLLEKLIALLTSCITAFLELRLAMICKKSGLFKQLQRCVDAVKESGDTELLQRIVRHFIRSALRNLSTIKEQGGDLLESSLPVTVEVFAGKSSMDSVFGACLLSVIKEFVESPDERLTALRYLELIRNVGDKVPLRLVSACQAAIDEKQYANVSAKTPQPVRSVIETPRAIVSVAQAPRTCELTEFP